MGNAHNIRTRKHEGPSKKTQTVEFIAVIAALVIIAAIIAGAIYLMR